MDFLILMRHGKAVRDHEAPDDRARGLIARGRSEAAEAGALLAREGLIPDRVIASPALRTRETFLAAAPALGKPHLRLIDDLYMADPETIWNEALNTGGAKVMVIGHNPGLHTLAAQLIHQDRDRSPIARRIVEHLPTAAYAAFEIRGSTLEAAGARLISAWLPR